ncbi:DNA cytosine methyltransferase [Pontibacillus salicampi]|uniref:Cytosine-specific methyltransferase n=1 Tax=Pontibacillus salicampi TaxID=1449801 RepID=A0ABV6LN02_9BACI
MKIEERGRGKYRPTSDYTSEDVKNILLEKIEEETSRIYEDEDDIDVLETTEYKKDKFNVISLFSGCGGLDLGFELSGLEGMVGKEKAMNAFKDGNEYDEIRQKSVFHTIYTNDLFKEANASYRKNFLNTAFQHEKDIRKVKYFPKTDMVIGGFPCPGFSGAGPRLVDDDRNFLYIHFIRCIMQSQPEIFVAENVKGLMTLGKGEVMKQIIEDFSSAGYNVKFKLINSRDYGVPQVRERVIIVGVKKGIDFQYEFPEPTHGDAEGLKPYVTLEDAIGDLREKPGPYFTGSFSSIYLSRNRKKSWDDQSFTIQASGRQAPLHPDGASMVKVGTDQWILPDGEENHRRLSVREIARIQTFPDWFEFSAGGNSKTSENGRLDKQYKQIGNAVPVLMAKAVADPITEWAIKRIRNRKLDEEHVQQVSLL